MHMTVSYLYKDDNKSSNITPSCKSTKSLHCSIFGTFEAPVK
jgi:hypothetical protein